jgi:4-hydroxy-tetrahydrodipicolinate reductase
MKAWLHGYSGRMGQEIIKAIRSTYSWTLTGGSSARGLMVQNQEGLSWDQFSNAVTDVDLVIDFSSVAGNLELLKTIRSDRHYSKALLIGSTGLDQNQIAEWRKLAHEKKVAILLAPNMSLGILLLHQVSKLLAEVLTPQSFDIEILETHHRSKLDAPSGTAKFLAQGIADTLGKEIKVNREGKRESQEIGVTALRGGNVFGEHEIQFLGDEEEIKISHRALNRGLFAKGALLLGEWIISQKPGFYSLEDITLDEMIRLMKARLGRDKV